MKGTSGGWEEAALFSKRVIDLMGTPIASFKGEGRPRWGRKKARARKEGRPPAFLEEKGSSKKK